METQTDKELVTIKYVKDLNLAEKATSPGKFDIGSASGGEEVNHTEQRKASEAARELAWKRHSSNVRDTEGLGRKGAKNCNVSVQCDIKIANIHYRQLQKHCIELRLENIKRVKRCEELEERIQKLLDEKNGIMGEFKKIQKQSFSAY